MVIIRRQMIDLFLSAENIGYDLGSVSINSYSLVWLDARCYLRVYYCFLDFQPYQVSLLF